MRGLLPCLILCAGILLLNGNESSGSEVNFQNLDYLYKPPASEPLTTPITPRNLPYPPHCKRVPDPGYEYPQVKNNVYVGDNPNFFEETKNLEPRTVYRSFWCNDPEYSTGSFYMLMTEKCYRNIGKNRNVNYYDSNGNPIKYSGKMVMLPLGIETPGYDYLNEDVTKCQR